MAGRPTKYTKERAAEICGKIVAGKSLRSICEASSMPSASTVFLWLSKHPEFSEQYAHAKDQSAESDADLIDEIVEKVLDNRISPERARVAGDLIKWSAGKKKPKKYGNTLIVENRYDVSLTLALENAKNRAKIVQGERLLIEDES